MDKTNFNLDTANPVSKKKFWWQLLKVIAFQIIVFPVGFLLLLLSSLFVQFAFSPTSGAEALTTITWLVLSAFIALSLG